MLLSKTKSAYDWQKSILSIFYSAVIIKSREYQWLIGGIDIQFVSSDIVVYTYINGLNTFILLDK